jgi:hypothetical protein
MNIFYLDKDIQICAQYHCDKHVVKMILEYAQILCTVLHEAGQTAPYQPTHKKHPCIVWTKTSLDNWLWLQELCFALNDEYQFRYKHNDPHKSFLVAAGLELPNLPSLGVTQRPQAMPDKYKVDGDPVTAYRNYYLGEKSRLLSYTNRNLPMWVTQKN